MDDNPTRLIDTDQSSWPNEAAERSCRAESGAYIVHPACAAPSGTKRLASITRPAAKNDQNDHMLMRGNAMSCVPILSGIRKLAYTPTRDRKSTRLNSSHDQISYAVFCLKKKKH